MPADCTVNVCVPPPRVAKVKFLASPVTVKLELSVPSIDIVVASSVKPALASISIPPALALISIASVPVPAEFNDNT